MMNLHAKSCLCEYVLFCEKWMNNEVVVVGFRMNSWVFVVNDVLEHVVGELV